MHLDTIAHVTKLFDVDIGTQVRYGTSEDAEHTMDLLSPERHEIKRWDAAKIGAFVCFVVALFGLGWLEILILVLILLALLWWYLRF